MCLTCFGGGFIQTVLLSTLFLALVEHYVLRKNRAGHLRVNKNPLDLENNYIFVAS